MITNQHQISSPTVIRGDLSIDRNTVLSLSHVHGLDEPLLTVLGTTTITGALVFNHDPVFDLSKPFMLAEKGLVLSGNVVATFGKTFPPMARPSFLSFFFFNNWRIGSVHTFGSYHRQPREDQLYSGVQRATRRQHEKYIFCHSRR